MKNNNPMEIFNIWFNEAKNDNQIIDHTAMSLATCNKLGIPSVRTVLLKDYSDNASFIFYTNLGSNKAHDLNENPVASLCFYWPSLDKQIRITGTTKIVEDKIADNYFNSRSKNSRLSAIISKQSNKLDDYNKFIDDVKELESTIDENNIKRPKYWSGFKIDANKIEFWLAGDYRMHKRHLYIKNNNIWTHNMLYP